MADPHRLLFYSYGGEADNPLRVKQLENNVTRAFINTLERVSHQTRLTILQIIFPKLKLADVSEVRFGLQRQFPDSASVAKRCLVTVTGRPPEGMTSESQLDDQRGIPDAWIHLPQVNTGCAIESKLGDRFSSGQVRRHLKSLGWSNSDSLRHLDWAQVAGRALDAGQNGTEVDRLLTGELAQYLEVIGMSTITQWTKEDFEALASSDSDYKSIIRRRLQDFTEIVHRQLPKALQRQYSVVRVGNLHIKNNHAWATIRQEQDSKNPFNNSNFAVSLRPDVLRAYAVVRDGRTTDRRKAMGLFYQAVRRNPEALVKILSASPGTFRFVVCERTGLNGKGPPRRGGEQWTELVDVAAKDAGDAFIPFLQNLLERIPFPGIRFGPTYSTRHVTSIKVSELAVSLSHDLELGHNLLRFAQS